MEKQKTLLLETELAPTSQIQLGLKFTAELFDDGSTDIIGETYDPVEDEIIPVRHTYNSTHFCKFDLARKKGNDETKLETFSSLEELKKSYESLSSKDKNAITPVSVLYDEEENIIHEVEMFF